MVKNQHTMGGKRKKTLKKFKKSRGGDYDNEETISNMNFDTSQQEINETLQNDDDKRIKVTHSAMHEGAKNIVDNSKKVKKGGKRRKTLKKSRKNKKSHKSKK